MTKTVSATNYVYDVQFAFENSNNKTTCKVTAWSQSQSLSYFDHDSNFCNMYNVLRFLGLPFTEPATSLCRWEPDIRMRD